MPAGRLTCTVVAIVFFFLAPVHCALPCHADELAGQASVIDGDTIEIHGQRIRLFGIDAVESSQRCMRGGQTWNCGKDSAFALADYIGRSAIVCSGTQHDRYGRLVAVCLKAGEDLNRWMVEQGWAVAYRHYSMDYVDAEESARAAGRHLWSSSFEMPWDWRHKAP